MMTLVRKGCRRAATASILLIAGLVAIPSLATVSNENISKKKLRILVIGQKPSIDPYASDHSDQSSTQVHSYLRGFISRPLTVLDKQWQWRCQHCIKLPSRGDDSARLLKSDTIAGHEEIHATWEIAPNAKWADGRPILAKDFWLGWHHACQHSKPLFCDRIERLIVHPKSNRRFTIVYTDAQFDFYKIGELYPLPSHLAPSGLKSVGALVQGFSQETPNKGLFSGPYYPTSTLHKDRLKLLANPHAADVRIREIDIQFVSAQELPAILARKGGLRQTFDMIAEANLDARSLSTALTAMGAHAEVDATKKVVTTLGNAFEHIDFNLRNPYLQDPNVRRALALSIDRKKLNNEIYSGLHHPANSLLHPKDPYFNSAQPTSFQPKESARLLDQAGWVMGEDGFRHRDGKVLSISLTIPKSEQRLQLAESLQRDWRSLGVQVTIEPQQHEQFFEETVRRSRYKGLALFAWVIPATFAPKTLLDSREIPSLQNGYRGQNSGGWRNPDVDRIFDTIKTEFSLTQRIKLMGELQMLYDRELPSIPLFRHAVSAIAPKTLKGFVLAGHQYPSSTYSEEWNYR